MARPFKQGLEYFPFDVSFFDDEKIIELNLERGYLGEIIYIRILSLIYANGYYLKISVPSLAKHIYRDMGGKWIGNVSVIEAVIRTCAEIGLLDKTLMNKDVMTSSSIQKQFILSTKRRQNINIDNYWLLDPTTTSKNRVLFNDSKNLVNVDSNSLVEGNNLINDYRGTQKEKEIDIIDKYIDKRELGIPTMHFLTRSLIEYNYISKYDLEYHRYNDLFKELLKVYNFDMVRSVVWYLVRYAKRSPKDIGDKFRYFKSSVINNLEMLVRKEMKRDGTWEDYIRRVIQVLDK